MELHTRSRVAFDMQNYQYHAPNPNSIQQEVKGLLIGHEVQSIVDAVNEERLMLLGSDTSIEEMIGVYEKQIVDSDDDATRIEGKEDDIIIFEFVLCDESGTVWSEVVEDEGSVDTPR